MGRVILFCAILSRDATVKATVGALLAPYNLLFLFGEGEFGSFYTGTVKLDQKTRASVLYS